MKTLKNSMGTVSFGIRRNSVIEEKLTELFLSVAESTENVNSDDGDPEDCDPDCYRHIRCCFPVLQEKNMRSQFLVLLVANDAKQTHLDCDTSCCDFKRQYDGPLSEVVPAREQKNQVRINEREWNEAKVVTYHPRAIPKPGSRKRTARV